MTDLQIKEFIDKYFENPSSQSIQGFKKVVSESNISLKQLENGIKEMLLDGIEADLGKFNKSIKKYCFRKIPTKIQAYNYPNKETEDFIEKILNDIEYIIQAAISNPETNISRNDRSLYKKIDKMQADQFCRMSKTFDLLYSGEIKLKAEKQDEFINSIDQLIHDLHWMKLEKPLFDLIRKDLFSRICIAFCNAIYDDRKLLYADWVRDLLLDNHRLNQIMVSYIVWRYQTDHSVRIKDVLDKLDKLVKKVA